jgi:hypothetical protein
MSSRNLGARLSFSVFLLCAAIPAVAQSFRVQCPTTTLTHPSALTNVNSEPVYTGATVLSVPAPTTYQKPSANVNGAIKCQQVSGGDGYATMGDGTQIFMFSFGPLSGLADLAAGLPGTEFPSVFNSQPGFTLAPGDPATTDGATNAGGYAQGTPTFTFNGAVGQVPDLDNGGAIDGHVDPRQIMDIGVMNGNQPGPMMAIDEDDEFFLTLTNVGMIMRPDLFEQHTIHFHGYPNASAFYDGVPDASVAVNIGGSMTYYYLAADAGTYFWHCHITPPEHLQMGMVGQLYVRPRQNRVPGTMTLYQGLSAQQNDLRTACNPAADTACTNPLPYGGDNGITGSFDPTKTDPQVKKYAYNDGDGSTQYDVEYPLQIHEFDPNFHFVGMTFNPEGFADMKDKYFLLNGRSYPDTVSAGPMATQTADGRMHYSQPLSSIINIPAGGRALLRISDLSVSEYATLATLGLPMQVIGYNAKLLRDQVGNNLYYNTNSITMAGGESADVILDACQVRSTTAPFKCTTPYTAGSVFYLYTPNLDHLANDAENFGGLMTEVHIN